MSEPKAQTIENSPHFVERLNKESHALLVSRLRYLLIIACFLYSSFIGLDFAATSRYAILFTIIRLVVVANYLLGIFLLSTEFGRRYAVALSIWTVYASELGVAIMTVYLGGFSSVYYIGIVFIIFVAGLFLPWRVFPTVLCGVLCMSSYFLLNFLFTFSTADSLFNVLGPFFFMGGAVVFTIFANVGQEKTRRNQLAMQMQIEKANEDLKELDKAKMRFFSNVSHELRSPLTLILGPLEAMLQGHAPADPRPLLEAMETNARRLLRQVNTLLDFAKIDAGKLECKFVYGNVGRLLEELMKATKPHTDNRNIELSIQGTESIPDSIIDVNKVETIAANLLSNAVKFTPDGGRIQLRADFDEYRVWFEVEDSGAGIPEDQLDQIFKRFLQLDDALSRRAEGTGLGLAMVEELTKLHSGKVSVRSTVGVGTIFTIELPRRPESQPIDRRRIIGRRKIDQLAQERTISMLGATYESHSGTKTLLADVAASKLSGGKLGDKHLQQQAPADAQKVLVVDDNPDIRTFMAGNLIDKYRIATAGDGVEALEVASRFHPDLIISDIMMPRMDGYELCRKIREDKTLNQTPIILATSKTGGDAVVEGLETGANDYLSKPFEIRELKARVAAHLRARGLERSLSERESRLAAIGQMTSSIVHDLKNPLSTIVGFAEIAQEDALAGESKEIVKSLDPIIKEAHRLSRMIAEVLDFARGYSTNVNLEPTTVIPYLSMVTATWHPKLSAIGISLVSDYDLPEKVQINLDQERMLRVMENLLKNAQEALCGEGRDPKGKHIWLTAKMDTDVIKISVTDDGAGIPEEISATIFEPFATAGKKSGTGLGLATVRNLVKAQGGDIEVIPKCAKGGAAFILSFPVLNSHEKSGD